MDKQVLFVCIVNRGQAEEVLAELRVFGLTGGMIAHGEGTSSSKLLNILGLAETRKEIIAIPCPLDLEPGLHQMMQEIFKIDKKNRGIAFTLPLARQDWEVNLPLGQGLVPKDLSHQLLIAIVPENCGRDCVILAKEAGAAGGTIMHGAGASIPKETAFKLEIEPYKDLVLFLVPTKKAQQIQGHIAQGMGLDRPGRGIIFSLPVLRTLGLYEGEAIS